MTFEIKKASKKQARLKLGLSGPSGSGKTWSSLLLAEGMGCKKIVVIDTERGSAELYSSRFNFDTINFEPPYSPTRYIEAIKMCEEAGYDMIIIDSISPEWEGEGGCLDMHSKIPGNSYTAWAKVTPKHNKFIESLLSCSSHLIVTTRAKTEYVLEEKNGKQVPRKLGMAPKQREGLEYELTCFLELNREHNFTASKDRTGLFDADVPQEFNAQVGEKLKAWLLDGTEEIKPAVKLEQPAKSSKKTDWKSEANDLAEAIEACETHEEILEVEKTLKGFYKEFDVPKESMKVLEDLVTQKITILEAPY